MEDYWIFLSHIDLPVAKLALHFKQSLIDFDVLSWIWVHIKSDKTWIELLELGPFKIIYEANDPPMWSKPIPTRQKSPHTWLIKLNSIKKPSGKSPDTDWFSIRQFNWTDGERFVICESKLNKARLKNLEKRSSYQTFHGKHHIMLTERPLNEHNWGQNTKKLGPIDF